MTRTRSALYTLAVAAAIVAGSASAASADTGSLAPAAPPASRGSVIDIVNDFLYCNAAEEASLDQMYPAGFVFFDCMRGGAPGSNG